VNVSELAITGGGVIDGGGSAWWGDVRKAKRENTPEPPRPRLVTLSRCQHIRLESITLRNSPSFHFVPSNCEDVAVTGVKITAPADSPNTDGIDPSASRNVRISKCTIDVGDDNIAVKSGAVDPKHPEAASEDIVVSDCVFLHGHGMSIGSETNGGVRNLRVERCTFRDTTTGIRIKSDRTRGGLVSNISYTDITMENVKTAILITAYYPKVPATDAAQPVTDKTPMYDNIRITNVKAEGSASAGTIVGVPERPLKGIVLDRVSIAAKTGLVIRNASVEQRKLEVNAAKGLPVTLEENGRLNAFHEQ
jgi:polygalacturonase